MRIIQMVLLGLLIVFSLALASCVAVVDKPEEAKETEPRSDDADCWRPGNETPPYPYAEELRRRLDPVIEDTFGIAEVEYCHSDLVKVNSAKEEGQFFLRYRLKNAPPVDEFDTYRTIHEVIDRVFDFTSFADADDIEGYVSMYGEEIPEEMAVALDFDDWNYYWQVFYDGEYLVFSSF